MKRLPELLHLAGLVAALSLAACGGGGGSAASSAEATAGSGTSGASAQAVSSGTISAFGSVFVNGHEFALGSARVIDDDTGASGTDMSALEVGMAVDIKTASHPSATSPSADEVHLHPLARGIVDASDAAAGTLTVMGQSVQLTAATNFSDHRACLSAATSPCTPVTGQSGLTATSGSGSGAVAGSYVTVHGYLYASGAAAAGANIVATLVSVSDLPTATAGPLYKAEGVVTATGSSSVTIGGLSVDLASATCYAAGSTTPCASAFGAGQVASVFGATAPALPAAAFRATTALLRPTLVVQTAGATVELEGKVSSVTASPAGFVLRGVAVDASALTSGSLPAVGDLVRVLGTVASGGNAVSATTVTVLHAARSATYGLEGNAAAVAAGSSAGTYVLTLLGQPISVDAGTRLADRSVRGHGGNSANPFNITTFQTYLAASASQHLLVSTQGDASGKLSALSVTIAPASTVSGISGVVDASPAPVNGSGSTASTFSVHGLVISADTAAIFKTWGAARPLLRSAPSVAVAAGDLVFARGTYAAGTISVTAPASTGDVVIDAGVPQGRDHDCF
jgi:hypothetical protein